MASKNTDKHHDQPACPHPQLLEGLLSRHSCRAFLPQPVPRDVLEAVFKAAENTPSAMNTQPWAVEVVTGDTLKKLSSALV